MANFAASGTSQEASAYAVRVRTTMESLVPRNRAGRGRTVWSYLALWLSSFDASHCLWTTPSPLLTTSLLYLYLPLLLCSILYHCYASRHLLLFIVTYGPNHSVFD